MLTLFCKNFEKIYFDSRFLLIEYILEPNFNKAELLTHEIPLLQGPVRLKLETFTWESSVALLRPTCYLILP